MSREIDAEIIGYTIIWAVMIIGGALAIWFVYWSAYLKPCDWYSPSDYDWQIVRSECSDLLKEK